jgi:hypothetical protein
MIDVDDAMLKAELDKIITSINTTMKKIEKIVPFKKQEVEQPEDSTNNKIDNQRTP